MLSAEREQKILSLLDDHGVVTVRDLAQLFDVTEVTVRRDLRRMEEQSLLRRTHGGAVGIDTPNGDNPATTDNSVNAPDDIEADALIIGPVHNRAAHTLRERAIRNKIPFFAESSPQDGAIYLGARNYDAGYDLGVWTGDFINAHLDRPALVLDVTQASLFNTRERSRGFIDGLHATSQRELTLVSVDGKALYQASYQVALDALRTHPGTNVIFGINDDSVLAGVQAYQDLGYDLAGLLAVNVGGEGSTIFNALVNASPLRACVALFPEIVGRLGVDATCRLWAGEALPDAIYTPHRLLTSDTLSECYERGEGGWSLRDAAVPALLDDPRWLDNPPLTPNKHLSFVMHYRTHEWYQNIARSMATRARALGVQFSVQDVKQDIQTEIRDLRRLIGKLAASTVADGDTVILDAGSTTEHMAQFLLGKRNLTVITNGLGIFNRLRNQDGVKLILTGGEYDPEAQAFVGRGAHVLLNEIRADRVFIVAGGMSSSFGVSSLDINEAEVRRHMVNAAREVVVLADHTVIGMDATAKVIDLNRVDTVITDAGIPAEHSLQLTQMGIEVVVAGQVNRR